MSDNNTTQLIQLTALLSKAQALLFDAYAEKEKFLTEYLVEDKFCQPKEAGDLKTLLWLQSKTKYDMDKIASLMCQVDKLTSPPACNSDEIVSFTDTQKAAIKIILANDKLAAKVASLEGKHLV